MIHKLMTGLEELRLVSVQKTVNSFFCHIQMSVSMSILLEKQIPSDILYCEHTVQFNVLKSLQCNKTCPR